MATPPPYTDPPHPQKAKARALKLVNKLFIPKNFLPIMASLEPMKDEQAFRTACTAAGCTTEETDWLWNYLKECNFGLWGNPGVPDASAGW